VRFLWLLCLLPGLLTASTTGCSDSSDSSSCCRVGTTGKACGDGCISQSDECHVGGWCACNG
jgi:hypothetical protein